MQCWGGGKICCPRFQKECNNKYDRMREGNEEGEPNAVMAANEVASTNAGWEKGCCVAKRREGMRVCVCVAGKNAREKIWSKVEAAGFFAGEGERSA